MGAFKEDKPSRVSIEGVDRCCETCKFEYFHHQRAQLNSGVSGC